MKNDIYDNMLSAYDLSTEQKKRNNHQCGQRHPARKRDAAD